MSPNMASGIVREAPKAATSGLVQTTPIALKIINH